MNTKTSLVLFGLLVWSCVVTESSDKISGVYTREFSFEVVNPEPGTRLGVRTIRDSIFIEVLGDAYEVSNRKWRKNDFDSDGWQSMDHSEDRPMATFRGRFNKGTMSLISESEPYRHLEFSEDKVFLGRDKAVSYQKLK